MGVKNPKIKEIFENMSYGEVSEDFKLADSWLKTLKEDVYPQYDVNEEEGIVKISTPEVVDNLIKGTGKVGVTFSNTERASFLARFANEIEKYSSTICQIEAKTRGIPIKDTQQQALPFLIESLRYYSSSSVKRESSKLEGIAAQIFSDQSFLGFIGVTVGPALVAGHFILLQTAPRISAVVTYITKLAKNAGCPDNVFTVVPGNVEVNDFINYDSVKAISAIDNFFSNKYSEIVVPVDKHFLAVSTSFRAPMIIFSNADLDSACESLIGAAWSYQGYLPWSVNQLLVQENIFNTVLDKLKKRLSRVRVGEVNDKLADIVLPKERTDIQKIIKDALYRGLEVYQHAPDFEKFQPTLIIGGRVYGNKVLTEDDQLPVVNILAFRTANEAAALANNSRQGLAASIWTENVALAEEVARNLKVTNVWINTHGNFTPTAPITFQKMSGVGSFAGREGYLEYLPITSAFSNEEFKENVSGRADLHGSLSSAKKAQNSWSKLGFMGRYKQLLKSARDIEENKGSPGVDDNKELVNIWMTAIYESLGHISSPPAFTDENYSYKCIREPLGIVAIEVTKGNAKYVAKTILAAILQGSPVILLNRSSNASFYSMLSRIMSASVPAGVFSVVNEPNYNTFKTAAMAKELNAIAVDSLRPFKDLFKIRDLKKILYIADSWEIAVAQTSVSKNVWCAIQESFI